MFSNKKQSSTVSFTLFTILKTIHFFTSQQTDVLVTSKKLLVNKSPVKVKVLNS